MKGLMLMKKDRKRKSIPFYWQVFVNSLLGKVLDKQFRCKFKLVGYK